MQEGHHRFEFVDNIYSCSLPKIVSLTYGPLVLVMQRVLQVEKCCSTAVRTKLIEVGAGARRAKRNEKVQLLGVSCPSKFPQYLFFVVKRIVGPISGNTY